MVLYRDEAGNPTTTERRKKRDFIYSCDTFCGRLNKVFSFLKTKYADKQIIVMTPLHRAYACFSKDNIQYNELYANGSGLFLESYVEAIRKAADIWSLNLIDLYRESGLFPLIDEYGKYFANDKTDRLHPNEKGHERIAKLLAEKLACLPVL